MKIGKIFLSSFSIFFSLSCLNTFGVKKYCPKKSDDEQSSDVQEFTCIGCDKIKKYIFINKDYKGQAFGGCKFRNDNSWRLCATCAKRLVTFKKLDQKKSIRNYADAGKILTRWGDGCMFCNMNNYVNKMRIKRAFNSQLNFRTKSFIYKMAKFHDRKNNTNIAEQLRNANPDYFDLLDDVSLISDNKVETWEFFGSHKVIDESGKVLDKPDNVFDIMKKKECRNCKEFKEVNIKKFCTFKGGNHDSRLCEDCLGKIIDSSFKCPSCTKYIKYSNPLPDNFEIN